MGEDHGGRAVKMGRGPVSAGIPSVCPEETALLELWGSCVR